MGYKISYTKRSHRSVWLTLGFFGLFLVFAWVFLGDQLRQLVFPRQLEELIEVLRQGRDLSNAVDAFCQGLLDGK